MWHFKISPVSGWPAVNKKACAPRAYMNSALTTRIHYFWIGRGSARQQKRTEHETAHFTIILLFVKWNWISAALLFILWPLNWTSGKHVMQRCKWKCLTNYDPMVVSVIVSGILVWRSFENLYVFSWRGRLNFLSPTAASRLAPAIVYADHMT